MSAYFEPGILLSDEELADRVRLRYWTMTQAFFWLQGHRSPGIEYSEGLRAWYPSAYNDAMMACIMGDIGQERTLAGEKVFFDKPTEWLAWADSLLEPGGFAVDERVRRLLSSGDDNAQLDTRARPKSGSRPKHESQKAKSPKRRRPGRKKGSGSFKAQDTLLFDYMRQIIEKGEATSPGGAALLLAEAKKVKGRGTLENRAKRLAKHFRDDELN